MDMIKQRKAELKARGKKGFTLMEMLIVVAIIAILIAIAIPIFTTQLNKARIAADEANIRSGYALVVSTVMTDSPAPADKAIYGLNTDGTISTGATGTFTAQGTNDTAVNIGGSGLKWKAGGTPTYTWSATDQKVSISMPE